MADRSVESYYDRNTSFFLRFGSSQYTRAIHRSLWPPGITQLSEALNVSNEMVYRELKNLIKAQSLAEIHMIDLGCGVGDSLKYQMQRVSLPARAVGVTISSFQARLAAQYIRQLGLSNSCLILAADFHHLPVTHGINLAFSIEAFVHSNNPSLFFQNVARILNRGGRLVICDDFKVISGVHPSIQQTRWLTAYQHGWNISNLLSVDDTIGYAYDAGLAIYSQTNLTPWLRLKSLPDHIASMLLMAGEFMQSIHPIIPSMLGSIALQQCLQAGWVEYKFLVFERSQ